jgi:hypothetical protein
MSDLLISLPDTDPRFFAELSKDPRKVQPPDPKLLRQHGVGLRDDPTHSLDLDLVNEDDAEPPFPFIGDDDENIPTTDVIEHITNGMHASNYLEKDGNLVSTVTEAERIDDLPEDELDIPGSDDEAALDPDSDSNSDSGSDFEEPEDIKPSSLIPTVTQGRSVRVRRQRDLAHLNRFWED